MNQLIKILLIELSFLALFQGPSLSQNNYSINVKGAGNAIIRGHLDLGGRNINGDSIEVNSFYVERNGKPFIPVIGEFHYSRYPKQYWDEEIKKIKAGGVNVIATYIFWNLHEFKEGVFDWSKNMDVRYFVQLCKENGLNVIMRIGPFAHGEMRNGGLPDWLYGRPIEVRSNDPAYLFYANRLYKEIGKQLDGLMFKDGGPVIGIQIENEYQHSASPWAFTYQDAPREYTVARRDRDITQIGVGVNEQGNEFADFGRDHMKTLKQLAINAGLIAPIYTATGWGYATIIEKGSIPVMAGYAYPFWVDGNQPSSFFLYKDIRKNPDYSPVSYDTNLYPSMAAELGTGISVTYTRRPKVPAESLLPMMVRTVGSGTNGLGFYMYHGGNTPSVGNYFMSEGFGLAHKSYDYQSPIGEFGNVSKGFYRLKLISYFLQSYSEILAPLYPVLPSTNDAIKAENTDTLRYAVRTNGEGGFLFMHNFQDRIKTKDLEQLKIEVSTKSGIVSFPYSGTFTLKSGASAIFPFNISFDGVDLHSASVQPFVRFNNKGKSYNIFVSIDGILPQIVLKGNPKISGTGIKVITNEGKVVVTFSENQICEMTINSVSFLIIPFEKALDAYLINVDEDKHLVLSKALVIQNKNRVSLISQNNTDIDLAIYPAINKIVSEKGNVSNRKSEIKNMSQWMVSITPVKPEINLIKASSRNVVLQGSKIDFSNLNDVFITFDYIGDRGVCMMDGEMVTDNLFTSALWTVGLKRYQEDMKEHEMYFYFVPMQKNAPYLRWLDEEVVPFFDNSNEYLEIKSIEVIPEYKVNLSIN